MADKTKIEWTERTWNPIVGCSLVSPGCTNCYAMGIADRFKDVYRGRKWAGAPAEAMTRRVNGKAVWTGQLTLAPDHVLLEPLRRRKPTTYFVNSMGDLFHEDTPEEWIDLVIAIMALCPQHTFQILTKRAERMRRHMSPTTSAPMLGRLPLERLHLAAAGDFEGENLLIEALKPYGNLYSLYCSVPWPLPNVWLGVSAEDQKRADERVPELLATPAAIRFVSAEPLLGPIDFESIVYEDGLRLDAFSGWHFDGEGAVDGVYGNPDPKLDWIIVGGESGHGARPTHPDWVRQIRDDCSASGTAFFFKQWGEWQPRRWKADGGTHAIRVTAPDWGCFQQIQSHPNSIERVEPAPEGWQAFAKVGKKAAGRRLDGAEHNAMPTVRDGR